MGRLGMKGRRKEKGEGSGVVPHPKKKSGCVAVLCPEATICLQKWGVPK